MIIKEQGHVDQDSLDQNQFKNKDPSFTAIVMMRIVQPRNRLLVIWIIEIQETKRGDQSVHQEQDRVNLNHYQKNLKRE